jgi:hypothetical protein
LTVGTVGTQVASRAHEKQQGNAMIAKIIEMLGDEKEKIGKDMEAETAQMDEYFTFCHREEDEKNYQIGRSNKKIDEKSAIIEDNTAQITALDEEIADLGTEMAHLVADQTKEDELRAEQKAEFKIREKEQIIMVDELSRLEVELEKQMEAMTTPPPVELLQDDDHAVSLLETAATHHEQKPVASFWANEAVQAKKGHCRA